MTLVRLSLVAVGTGLITLALAPSTSAQQIPARGLSSLVCALGVQGNGTYPSPGAGKVSAVVSGDTVTAGVGTATVAIQHGVSGSTHQVTYQDNGTGVLDCGDAIIGVQ